MTYESSYGKQEGLRERIDGWIQRLSTDKTSQWVGLGLIADLKAIGREMDGSQDSYIPLPYETPLNEEWDL